MNFTSPGLDIIKHSKNEPNSYLLSFTFKGKFTTETSVKGSDYWSSLFDDYPEASFEFEWNCLQMAGFEINARKEWYKSMQRHKNRIKKVTVICDHLMIRSAARVMLKFFNIPGEFKRSMEPSSSN